MKGQEILFSSNSDEWSTPINLFNLLNSVCDFDTDLAASDSNYLVANYYTATNSSLDIPWDDMVAFLNPPYSNCKSFVLKAASETKARLICVLVPARVDTAWMHQLPKNTLCFAFKGRLKFVRQGVEKQNTAPFPSILIFLGSDVDLYFYPLNKVLRDRGRFFNFR